ncbi:hypothetical protein MA16_Dca013184 [Dendrobium catenatum]|uniref:Uncharacterized protein n=1 Tax=Dendrobium catenatum TaxID=906689 RepID=A0A2I0WR28_9ASPA|nr:hypothetical protein MA16_Dca013184 [Dendrobium catenatum]
MVLLFHGWIDRRLAGSPAALRGANGAEALSSFGGLDKLQEKFFGSGFKEKPLTINEGGLLGKKEIPIPVSGKGKGVIKEVCLDLLEATPTRDREEKVISNLKNTEATKSNEIGYAEEGEILEIDKGFIINVDALCEEKPVTKQDADKGLSNSNMVVVGRHSYEKKVKLVK